MPVIYGSDFGVNIPEEEFNSEIAQREYENYMRAMAQMYDEAYDEEFERALEQGSAVRYSGETPQFIPTPLTQDEYHDAMTGSYDGDFEQRLSDMFRLGAEEGADVVYASEVPAVSYEDHCTTPRSPQEENNALREQWQYETERQQYEERWRRYERSVREYLETINRLNRDTVEVPPSRARESPPERRRRLIELAERYGGEEELNY